MFNALLQYYYKSFHVFHYFFINKVAYASLSESKKVNGKCMNIYIKR